MEKGYEPNVEWECPECGHIGYCFVSHLPVGEVFRGSFLCDVCTDRSLLAGENIQDLLDDLPDGELEREFTPEEVENMKWEEWKEWEE